MYSDILQNASFRSQIFFASGGKGALTPITKILRTFLAADYVELNQLELNKHFCRRFTLTPHDVEACEACALWAQSDTGS